MKKTFLGIEINYKNSPIDIREKFYLNSEKLEGFILELKNKLNDFFVLSTCNRFGIYGIFDNYEILNIPKNYIMIFEGVDLIRHIFKVASGLDSQIIGEHQIAGQLRESLKLALKHKTISHFTNQLISRALRTSKRIKNETNLKPISLNYYITEIIKNRNINNVLIFGTGEISQMLIRKLKNYYKVFISSKNLNRAIEISKFYNVEFIDFLNFKNYLKFFELIICATENENFIISVDDLKFLNKRAILIDVSVPRVIDPKLKNYLLYYDLDDLRKIDYKLDENEIKKAYNIIEDELRKFLFYLKELKSYEIVSYFRKNFENSSKVLHKPTIYIKNFYRKKDIIIGTRGSLLAIIQAKIVLNELQKFYPYFNYSIKIIKTKGDEGKFEGYGAFVREIENALINNEIDIAVHSLKDIPIDLPDGIIISAVLKREDVRDVLVSKDNKKLFELPKNSIIGTSSQRRIAQLLNLRNDLIIKEIRGNIDTRLRKLDNNEYSAIIISKVSLDRLNLSYRISEIFDVELFVPSAGQGAIAIETREDDIFINNIIVNLNHYESFITTKLEREFLRLLGSGCKMPHGVYCYIENNKAKMIAFVYNKKFKVESGLNEIENLPYELYKEVLKYEKSFNFKG